MIDSHGFLQYPQQYYTLSSSAKTLSLSLLHVNRHQHRSVTDSPIFSSADEELLNREEGEIYCAYFMLTGCVLNRISLF